MERQRDSWFLGLIFFLFISCLIGGYRGVEGIFEESYLLPLWYYYLNILMNIGGVISLYFFYQLKKNGVLLFVAFLLIDFFVPIIFVNSLNSASFFFIFLVTLFLGLKVIPNWTQYD